MPRLWIGRSGSATPSNGRQARRRSGSPSSMLDQPMSARAEPFGGADQRAATRRALPPPRRRHTAMIASRRRPNMDDRPRLSVAPATIARSHSVSVPIERLFRFAEPMRRRRSSTIISLECTIVSDRAFASRAPAGKAGARGRRRPASRRIRGKRMRPYAHGVRFEPGIVRLRRRRMHEPRAPGRCLQPLRQRVARSRWRSGTGSRCRCVRGAIDHVEKQRLDLAHLAAAPRKRAACARYRP